MITIKGTAPTDREMVDLFSINDKVYQMPARVGATIALGYMKLVRTHGQDAAMGWTLERVLGTEAYDALMNCDDVGTDDLETIMKVVHDNVMGAVEAGKGKGPRG